MALLLGNAFWELFNVPANPRFVIVAHRSDYDRCGLGVPGVEDPP